MGETNSFINQCLFLLTWKSGLRITEATSFDVSYSLPENKNFFNVCGKGSKNRVIFVSDNILKELKKRD
jgi:site-specific recombinase XerD